MHLRKCTDSLHLHVQRIGIEDKKEDKSLDKKYRGTEILNLFFFFVSLKISHSNNCSMSFRRNCKHHLNATQNKVVS